MCFRFCPATMIPRRSWATTWTLRYSPAKCAWCLTVSTGARCACGWSCEGAPLTVSTYMFNILQHFYTSSHTCHVCMFIVPFSWREETLGNPLYSISRRKKSCFPTLSGKMTSKAGREQPLFFLFGCRRWLILAVCVLHAQIHLSCRRLSEKTWQKRFRSFHYMLILRVCIWADKFRSSARAPTQRRNDLIKFSACSQHFMPLYTHYVWRSLHSGAQRWTSMCSLSYYCVWVFERVARSQKARL
jgi:hypothetical protein